MDTIDALIMLVPPAQIDGEGKTQISFSCTAIWKSGVSAGQPVSSNPVTCAVIYDYTMTVNQLKTAILAAATDCVRNHFGIEFASQGSRVQIVGL